jgi:ABC-type lipoprotein release transport system permease subunit
VTPPLYIALRFLTHRKRPLLLSLSGVVFGVAIFICTQAQTQGFARYFIDSTIGSNGALVIRSRFRPRYEPLMVSAKGSNGIVGRSLYPMWSPVPRSCAERSALVRDLRTRPSIFTASIRLCMPRRPIFSTN